VPLEFTVNSSSWAFKYPKRQFPSTCLGAGIFHPRHALRGFINWYDYGDVVKYYVRAGGSGAGAQTAPTERDAIDAGLAILENPVLTAPENAKLAMLSTKMPPSVAQNFHELLAALQQVWASPWFAMQSDPGKQKDTTEYQKLVEYCQLQGTEIWPLLFRSYIDGRERLRTAIFEITETKRATYRKIRDDGKGTRYTPDGKFIIVTPHSLMYKYVKALLAEM
jgi:hypothetical protein